MWTRARATGRDCQSCAAKGCTTRVYCGKCRRLVCLTCAGRVEMPLSAFGRCLSCVAGRHTTGLRWRVAQARLRVEELEYRSSSRRAWRRGVASLREYTDLTGERFFPCTVDTLLNWGAWALLARKPQGLDASTLRAYASGVDQMHAQAARGLGEKVLNPTRSVEWRRFARTGVRRLKNEGEPGNAADHAGGGTADAGAWLPRHAERAAPAHRVSVLHGGRAEERDGSGAANRISDSSGRSRSRAGDFRAEVRLAGSDARRGAMLARSASRGQERARRHVSGLVFSRAYRGTGGA